MNQQNRSGQNQISNPLIAPHPLTHTHTHTHTHTLHLFLGMTGKRLRPRISFKLRTTFVICDSKRALVKQKKNQLYLFTQERIKVTFALGIHKNFLLLKRCWIFSILMYRVINLIIKANLQTYKIQLQFILIGSFLFYPNRLKLMLLNKKF